MHSKCWTKIVAILSTLKLSISRRKTIKHIHNYCYNNSAGPSKTNNSAMLCKSQMKESDVSEYSGDPPISLGAGMGSVE